MPRIPVKQTKMGHGDDTKAFLVTFECVATVAARSWGHIFGPVSAGQAQAAYTVLRSSHFELFQYLPGDIPPMFLERKIPARGPP